MSAVPSMSPASRLQRVDPLTLANVWKVDDFASEEKVLSSGHQALDAQLPGGGWPLGSMVEVLHSPTARHDSPAAPHVWQLILPGLVNAIGQSAGPVVLIGSPHEPFGPSLQAQGLPATRLLWVKASKPAARLWASEQALKCAEVAAVVAWLPQAKGAELRRLQMAAHQQGRLLFVFRDAKAMSDASPARLRLLVEGTDVLQLRIVKRRGPPIDTPIELPATSKRLAALIEARNDTRKRRSPTAPAVVAIPLTPPKKRSHVLDRAVAHT